MRATIVLLIVLVLAGASLPRSAFSQGAEQDQSIMQVVVANHSKGRFFRRGTAFHVGDGIFYTNAHVVKKDVPEGYTDWYLAPTTATTYVDSWVGPISVTCVHPLWRDTGDPARSHPYDVARLRAPLASPLLALPFHDRPPQVGQAVTIKGFPAASRAWPPILYTATGRISEVWRENHWFRIKITSGLALRGSSGSPVLLGLPSEEGRVVGIMFAGLGGEDRIASELVSAVFASTALEGCPR